MQEAADHARSNAQVVLTDMRYDVPRHSWSEDFYSLSCSQASIVHPATSGYIEQLKPDMQRCELARSVESRMPEVYRLNNERGPCRPPTQHELERASFQTAEGCDWWEYLPRLMRSQAPITLHHAGAMPPYGGRAPTAGHYSINAEDLASLGPAEM